MEKESLDINMSRLREMQLEIVKMIEKVDMLFRENNIQYFIIGGSVLGAVRHKGFIPWDDDMDIGIKRSDFQKAEALLLTLKEYVYETTEKHIIPDGPTGHIHLINEKYPIEKSPTIDVFALDGVPEEPKQWKKLRIAATWYHLAILNRPALNRGFLKKLVSQLCLKCIPKFIWKMIKTECYKKITSYNIESAPYITNIFGIYGSKEFFPRIMFDSITYGEFEGLKLPMPANPHEYLTQIYGNYMELPPIEKRIPKHNKN